MPPVDHTAAVQSRLAAAVRGAVEQYNLDLAAGLLPAGCVPVDLATGLLFDYGDGQLRAGITVDEAAAYPQVHLSVSGGSQPKPLAVTFGLMGGAPGCDAILPRVVTWVETVTLRPEQTDESTMSPLESYIDAAMDDLQPQMAVPATNGRPALPRLTSKPFSRNHTSRKREPVGGNGLAQTVRRTSGSVEIWTHRNG